LVTFEKKKCLKVQEEKIEKSSSLMHELVERDKAILNLRNEMRFLRDEKLELESTLNRSEIDHYKSGIIGNGIPS
jgi:hypothetical protein